MVNSTYIPKRYEDLNADSCIFDIQGVLGIAVAGTSTNIDLKLTDDHLITGISLMASGSVFGDSITLQVIDNDLMLQGIYGVGITSLYPSYPVLRQFASNFMINADTELKMTKEKAYPAKIIAGLYIRVIYTSIGTNDVSVIANYDLHKVLI